MPNIGFFKSLRTLDDARLSRQRQDALNTLKGLMGDKSVPHHMVMDMWEGYEYTLGVYAMSACSLWQNERGKRDSLAFEVHAILEGVPHELDMPPWVEDLNFHRSHRSYLIRRDPENYATMWPNTPENMPILWPQLVDSAPLGYRLRVSDLEARLLAKGERKLPEWMRYDKHKREAIDLEDE